MDFPDKTRMMARARKLLDRGDVEAGRKLFWLAVEARTIRFL